jgi:hypothetical protein
MTQRAESSCPRTGRFHAQNRERRFHAQNRERETPGARLGTRSMGPRRPAPGAHESLIKRRLPPAPGRRASPAARAAPPWCGLSRPSPCPPPPRALQATGRSAAPPAPRQCRAQCRCAQSTGRRRFGARGPGGGAGRLQHAREDDGRLREGKLVTHTLRTKAGGFGAQPSARGGAGGRGVSWGWRGGLHCAGRPCGRPRRRA